VAYSQGAIVIADDPFDNNPKRPYLILSNDHVPFHGQEYVAAVITTTARTEAVELTANRLERGRLPRTSYVSPWSVLSLKDWMITKQPAEATDATVDEVRQELDTYLQTG
jgi:mRNA interferase MazF